MSEVYTARTNQKLHFSRLHLQALADAQTSSDWSKHALVESYHESVLFHLTAAYSAFLREIAEEYRLDVGEVDGFRELMRQFEEAGYELAEITELANLETTTTSWLHKMLYAYEGCWSATKSKMKAADHESSVSEIHVMQINPDHSEDGKVAKELQFWHQELSSLIERLRMGMQEY